MTGVTAAFNKPFKFQVAAFRLRLAQLQATTGWTDVWQSEHDRAFMVAGAMKADVLADLAAAVDKAVTQGTTLEEFRRDFRKIVAEKGWQISPAGQGTKKGEAWRTKVIYRTNVSTSYHAGRFAQLTAAKFPYWIYFHGNSAEPRLQHLAWNGLILPADHPFWATHYPPNGWGCSCYVSGARSLKSAAILGGKPDLKLPDNWASIDPRTGAPVGISKGWAYAPGATVANTVAALAKKLDDLPGRPSVDLIQSWLRTNAFAEWFAAPVGSWPLARLTDADAAMIGSTQKVAVLSEQSAEKQAREHPELTAQDYLAVQSVIDNATRRIREDARRLIFVQEVEGAPGYVLVVKAVIEKDELCIVSYRRLSKDQAKRDRDILNLLRKDK